MQQYLSNVFEENMSANTGITELRSIFFLKCAGRFHHFRIQYTAHTYYDKNIKYTNNTRIFHTAMIGTGNNLHLYPRY